MIACLNYTTSNLFPKIVQPNANFFFYQMNWFSVIVGYVMYFVILSNAIFSNAEYYIINEQVICDTDFVIV